MDGKSLVALVSGNNDGWRKYIDLEHATCYSADNYWCALTDGKMKYIWFIHTGEEQLFDLSADPGERKNLLETVVMQTGWLRCVKQWFVTCKRGEQIL